MRAGLTWISTEPGGPGLTAQDGDRLTEISPPPRDTLHLLLPRPDNTILLLLFLLLLPPVLVPPVVGPGLGDGLDGVGGEGPHVTDGVQEVVPGGQTDRQRSATRLKTLKQNVFINFLTVLE